MQRNFGWKNFARVWRSVVRVLTHRRFRRTSKRQVVEKTEVAVETRRADSRRSVGGAATEKRGEKDGVSFDKTTSCRFVGEEKSEMPPTDAEIGLDRDKKPEILAKNALDETSSLKTNASVTQVIENKTDNVDFEGEKTVENDDVDERKQDAASLRSTEDATLKDNAQLQSPQGIREWINDEGKIGVKAALEIELSAFDGIRFLRSLGGRFTVTRCVDCRFRLWLERQNVGDKRWN